MSGEMSKSLNLPMLPALTLGKAEAVNAKGKMLL